MLGDDRGDLGVDVGRRVGRLGRGERVHVDERVERGPHQRDELGIGRGGDREGERGDVDAGLALHHEREEGLLALGVGVEQPGGDAGRGRDVGHAGAAVPGGGERGEGGGGDGVEALGRRVRGTAPIITE